MSKQLDIARMAGPAYSHQVRKAPGILLPLASVEILGSHGPLGADLLVANHVTPLIAQRTGCLYAPAIPYGDTLELAGWEGTVHVPSLVLEGYYEAIACSFLEQGQAAAVVFIAYHSLNLKAVDAACRKLKAQGHTVAAVDWWRAAGQFGAGLLQDQQSGTGHGAELTTSVLMAIEEGLLPQPLPPGEPPQEGLARVLKHQFGGGSAFQAYGNFQEYCTSGAWGDLSGASKEKGLTILEGAVALIAQAIEEALN